MKLSICPRIIKGLGGRNNTITECMQSFKSVGIDTFDFGIISKPGSCFTYADNWEEQAKQLAEDASQMGVSFFQSHAPYAYFLYNDIEYYREITRRSIEICKILGVKYIVVHAELKFNKGEEFNADKSLKNAYEFYAPFVELAKKLGVGIAIENLFDAKKRYNYTATVEEQLEIINKFNDNNVSACWDFGHGHVMHGENHLTELRKLGNLLTCTHVHDNKQKKDLHTIPFMGDINWNDVMAYLKEINYTGSFNYELILGKIPEALIDSYIKLIYNTGMHLLSL